MLDRYIVMLNLLLIITLIQSQILIWSFEWICGLINSRLIFYWYIINIFSFSSTALFLKNPSLILLKRIPPGSAFSFQVNIFQKGEVFVSIASRSQILKRFRTKFPANSDFILKIKIGAESKRPYQKHRTNPRRNKSLSKFVSEKVAKVGQNDFFLAYSFRYATKSCWKRLTFFSHCFTNTLSKHKPLDEKSYPEWKTFKFRLEAKTSNLN